MEWDDGPEWCIEMLRNEAVEYGVKSATKHFLEGIQGNIENLQFG
jgi:hypothetical protein